MGAGQLRNRARRIRNIAGALYLLKEHAHDAGLLDAERELENAADYASFAAAAYEKRADKVWKSTR